MERIQVPGRVLGAILVAVDAARLSSQIAYNAFDIVTLRALRLSFVELEQDYGFLQAALLVFIFPDARHVLKRIQQHLLEPQLDEVTAMEEALALKKSMADDCSMLAVAAAIVAQVAITALSLEDLSATHWTAKAAFVLSLASGALSVFFACLLQRRVSSMFGLSDLKDWLSKPAGNQGLREVDNLARGVREARLKMEANATAEPLSEQVQGPWSSIDKGLTQLVDEELWVYASFNAALMIKIPPLLLNWSVGALLVGLGVYLGSFWTQDLDSNHPPSSSLGVLITYIIVTAIGLLLFFVPTLLKYLEGAPNRRLVERVVERVDPKDRPSGLNVDDILDSLDRSRVRSSPKKPSIGERPGVDEHYQVPSNKSSASFHHMPATADAGVQMDDDFPTPQVKDAIVDEIGTKPPLKANLAQTFHNREIANSGEKMPALGLRRATEPARLQADPLVTSLEASILAQERSVESFRALLKEHQRLLGVRRRVLS